MEHFKKENVQEGRTVKNKVRPFAAKFSLPQGSVGGGDEGQGYGSKHHQIIKGQNNLSIAIEEEKLAHV